VGLAVLAVMRDCSSYVDWSSERDNGSQKKQGEQKFHDFPFTLKDVRRADKNASYARIEF
jgi:hypothetical protein